MKMLLAAASIGDDIFSFISHFSLQTLKQI